MSHLGEPLDDCTLIVYQCRVELLIHRQPSIGSITKKILAINPQLEATEVISIIRQAVHTQGKKAGEFASAEVIDEVKALAMARMSRQVVAAT